jgi:hypothetical protein
VASLSIIHQAYKKGKGHLHLLFYSVFLCISS